MTVVTWSQLMDWINRIYKVQIDVTSHCNAKCPGCVRSLNTDESRKNRNKHLELTHFDMSIWHELCVGDNGFKRFKYFNELVLNGTWGDPCMFIGLPEMLKLFTETYPRATINMHTNGGAQTEEWWYRLGKQLSTHPHAVIFAIDGLEDTHSLYRVGTEYDKVIKHARAFIEGGGSARWTMTVFDHNQHQVDQAEHLATKYEFKRFHARRSHTQYMNVNDEYEISTDLIDDSVYRNVRAAGANKRVKFVPIDSRPDIPETESQCQWYADGAIQIDAWGTVWPCCHTAPYAVLYNAYDQSDFSNDENNYITHNPTMIEDNSLNNKTLYDILSESWYVNKLSEQVENASLVICKNNCGVKNKNGAL